MWITYTLRLPTVNHLTNYKIMIINIIIDTESTK